MRPSTSLNPLPFFTKKFHAVKCLSLKYIEGEIYSRPLHNNSSSSHTHTCFSVTEATMNRIILRCLFKDFCDATTQLVFAK